MYNNIFHAIIYIYISDYLKIKFILIYYYITVYTYYVFTLIN